jgi:hypothetical protein
MCVSPVGQLFNANRRTGRALLLFGSRLEGFFERAHRHVVTDIDVAAQNFANRSEQLFLRRFFHHVTLRACTESTLCEDGFFESGINENQQSRKLRFER